MLCAYNATNALKLHLPGPTDPALGKHYESEQASECDAGDPSRSTGNLKTVVIDIIELSWLILVFRRSRCLRQVHRLSSSA
jgi:hypothetical protein